jgi:hypothetical protein
MGRWGYCSANQKIDLTNGRSRYPDLSFWGFPRCQANESGVLVPAVINGVPDVVIQFSWKNSNTYETAAMNDMMTMARESTFRAGSTTRPTLGYLIKAKFAPDDSKKKRKRQPTPKIRGTIVGLYIYRLPHGTTVADALNNNNGASVHFYKSGDPEYLITITPADLGITGFWAYMCGNYTIKASVLLVKMQVCHEDLKKEEMTESLLGLASSATT